MAEGKTIAYLARTLHRLGRIEAARTYAVQAIEVNRALSIGIGDQTDDRGAG